MSHYILYLLGVKLGGGCGRILFSGALWIDGCISGCWIGSHGRGAPGRHEGRLRHRGDGWRKNDGWHGELFFFGSKPA